jgi:hypothetical protein
MPSTDPRLPEQSLHRLLRNLPDRPAPRTLQHRVLAELERRAAEPSWRRSYASWPAWLRGAFVLGALLAAAVAAAGPARVLGEMALRIDSLSFARTVVRGMEGSARDIVAAIPATWLYAAAAAVAASYAILAGLGAAAYRAFAHSRHHLLSNA